MEAVFQNVELSNWSYGIAVRHAQMRHRVQCRTPDQHLRRLPGKLPRADAVAEDRLHPEHLRLRKTPPMIADFLLPLFASNLPDAPQVLITDQSLCLTIAMLPDLRIAAWRNRRLRF